MEKNYMSPEEFAKLPLNERKLLIVQDILDSLNSDKIIVRTHNVYLDVYKKNANPLDSARDFLIENETRCTVCARGALFVSAVKYKNKLRVEDLENGDFEYTYADIYNGKQKIGAATSFLGEEFSIQEQRAIETFFEGNPNTAKDDVLGDRIVNYRRDTLSTLLNPIDYKVIGNHLIREICNNILKNNGTFVLPENY